MRLKLFHAPNMTAAMALVRDSLGPDALILSTRRVSDGVEVTAALEPAPTEAPPLPAPPPTPPPPFPTVDPARNAALAWHGVPPGLVEALAPGQLADTLPGVLLFGDLPLDGAAPLLVAGPPGAGKTLTVAKLATRLVMTGRTPLVVTADGRRAGAPEQLAAYTRLLGLTLVVASTPAPLSRALARSQDSPVLIDTPGLDPFDASARGELLALAAAAGAVTALVLPAGLDPAEARELAEAFAEAGATLLIATRLDVSRRLGGVLAAATAGLTVTEAGTGPGAADGLRPLTPELLASRLTIPPGRAPAPQDIAS